jgi:hypothetical protein
MDTDASEGAEAEAPAPAEQPEVVLTPDTIAEALRRAMMAAPELEDHIRSVFEPSESGLPLRRR